MKDRPDFESFIGYDTVISQRKYFCIAIEISSTLRNLLCILQRRIEILRKKVLY